jgi:hypothetical protein
MAEDTEEPVSTVVSDPVASYVGPVLYHFASPLLRGSVHGVPVRGPCLYGKGDLGHDRITLLPRDVI